MVPEGADADEEEVGEAVAHGEHLPEGPRAHNNNNLNNSSSSSSSSSSTTTTTTSTSSSTTTTTTNDNDNDNNNNNNNNGERLPEGPRVREAHVVVDVLRQDDAFEGECKQ